MRVSNIHSPGEKDEIQILLDAHIAAIDPHTQYFNEERFRLAVQSFFNSHISEYHSSWLDTYNLLQPDLVGFWPLRSDGKDVGPNGFDATVYKTTFDGTQATLNGTDSALVLPNMAGKFNGQEFGVSMDIVPSAGSWGDTLQHWILYMQVDGNNKVALINDAGTFKAQYIAGGIGYQSTPPFTPEGHRVNIVWTGSKVSGKLDLYINGALIESQVMAATFSVSNLTDIFIGSAGYYWGFSGNIRDVALTNKLITADKALRLSNSHKFTVIGDSVSSLMSFPNYADITSWYYDVALQQINHAVAGMGILVGASNLASQVISSASDDAEKIIVALGTNDDNAGNMTTLQAAVENAIDALRLSNPRAVIYYLGPLSRWTDNTGSTPVDKSNIRTAISAGCTSRGVTYLDTTGWITANQTTDGLHPNAAGHAAIATQVLARMP